MSEPTALKPRRIMMTLDAVGGVWRYALDLAAGLLQEGVETLLVGLGPAPSPEQRAEALRCVGALVWLDLPLDWLADRPDSLAKVGPVLARLAERRDVDLLHLNEPSQAAFLEPSALPVVVVAHSCLATWWRAVRLDPLPQDWLWRRRAASVGFSRADLVIAPSAAHAAEVAACYELKDSIHVAHNASRTLARQGEKTEIALAAARWWDEAKNGAALDMAAARSRWPIYAAGAIKGPNGSAFQFRHAHGLGHLSPAHVEEWIAKAAVLVSPSLYEPFGLAALEAASAGAALVLSDIATYRELWDGAAIFADPRDPPSFAGHLDELAAHPARRRELAAAARERARRFAPALQTRAMLDGYRSAVRRAATR